MQLNKEEKRVLEIYVSYLTAHIRKNNTKALEDLRAFFYSLSFRRTYDPAIISETILNNIEIISQIPTRTETVLCMAVTSEKINITKKMFWPYYSKTITGMAVRKQQFAMDKVILRPKIIHDSFHYHLLIFLQEFAIMGKRIPIKGAKNGK